MAVASFQDLCAGFCDLINVSTPRLKADEYGRVGFRVYVHGTTVNVVHCAESSADHAFIFFKLGAMSGDQPDAIAQLIALLESNYVALQVHPPVVSRNPDTGDALLQFIYPLFDATPSGLYALIEQGVDRALHWRDHLTSGDPATSARQVPVSIPLPMLNLA